MEPTEMTIDEIPAHELELGHIIGEGMMVWCIMKAITDPEEGNITVWWGEPGCSIMSGAQADDAHRIRYKPEDRVRIIRRR